MFKDLNERLAAVKEKARGMEKWEARLHQLQEELVELERTRDQSRRRLAAEEKDVERLSGASLSAFIYSILGKKLEKLDQEQREALEAKIKYEHAERAVQDVQQQIDQVQQRIREVRNSEADYELLFQEKERRILDSNQELRELADRLAELMVQNKELQEALDAGISVQEDLRLAEESLNSARNWGTYDMLGGGMISTHIKHSRIDGAMEHVYRAENNLQRFSKELRDVGDTLSVDMKIDGFLTFTDYFFDNLITDWFVQGRINEILNQVITKASQVDELMDHLSRSKRQAEQQFEILHRQYVQMVETYH
ncbi:hypothetical protein M3201_09590 [Paenibacillus motobuensis]|uniref:hypothetical protein n=1 Tax=Paenibacillus TaxID=44249 RepID=UPI0020408383|nr:MULTISPECIES: hypothetical protein [Paenibacillus]MCM3039946.1 hypothetical protein [Paenibacillus lutimineralis]MCM3647050.1 hypothetical protein [Paenibacillus motobuensis]